MRSGDQPMRDAEPGARQCRRKRHCLRSVRCTFGPIYLTTQVSITGPEDGSLNIVWNAVAPGCVGAAPGTCGLSTANYAVEVAAGASDGIKLKNVLINNGGGFQRRSKDRKCCKREVDPRGSARRQWNNPQLMTVAPNTGSQFHLLIKEGDIAYSNSGGGVLVQPQGSTSVAADITGTLIHNFYFWSKIRCVCYECERASFCQPRRSRKFQRQRHCDDWHGQWPFEGCYYPEQFAQCWRVCGAGQWC